MCIINICLDRKMSKELFKSNIKRINTSGKRTFENINHPSNQERLPNWPRLERMVPSVRMDVENWSTDKHFWWEWNVVQSYGEKLGNTSQTPLKEHICRNIYT